MIGGLQGIKKDVKGFIENESDNVFKRTMQKMVDNWFQEIDKNPKIIKELMPFLKTAQKKYIENHSEYYDILNKQVDDFCDACNFALIYRYFPEKILISNLRSSQKNAIISGSQVEDMPTELRVNSATRVAKEYLK